jgi:ketosteroid isomerase-like protein
MLCTAAGGANHMKHGLLFVLCISGVLACGQTGPAASSRASDEATIRSLNETVLKAYNVGDLSTVERIEDADFTLAGAFGQLTKAQEMDRERQRKDFVSSIRLTVEKAELRFYGNTALLTEVEKWGDPAQTAGFQTTSLWVRRGAEWKIVHLHYSKLGTP